MVYSTAADIQARIPFLLDTNSKPTLINAGLIQASVNRFINAILDKTVDLTTAKAVNDLRWVEEDLSVNYIMAIHDGHRPPMEFTKEHKRILSNLGSKKNIDVFDLEFKET